MRKLLGCCPAPEKQRWRGTEVKENGEGATWQVDEGEEDIAVVCTGSWLSPFVL